MRREEGAMSPVLPASDEEALDRDRTCFARQSEHVGIAKAFGMHGLAALDVGQRAQPVAIDGGKLVILPLGRLRHQLGEARLHVSRLAGEERLGVVDQLAIFVLGDPADAGRRAALDLEQQAW